jgi:hypothetical protein
VLVDPPARGIWLLAAVVAHARAEGTAILLGLCDDASRYGSECE